MADDAAPGIVVDVAWWVEYVYLGTPGRAPLLSHLQPCVHWKPTRFPTKTPLCNLGTSTAMISAGAWNNASPSFQVRIYVTGESGELQEYLFSLNADGISRDVDGWMVTGNASSGFVSQTTHGLHISPSAVPAVMLENGCNPKVYFPSEEDHS
ncbi:hypothetical protein GGR52DRAFT_576389 [Hypoxylon sp. FL1284]|nr:hypothetical protein GGR52DRAFT_576389 [Hypoxylon sp. FL1284]